MADQTKIYQVSTLQALAMGYSRKVITVGELLEHGDIGLGTFEDVNGEMIVLDGRCFRALHDGTVFEAKPDMGVPFAAVTKLTDMVSFDLAESKNIDEVKETLTLKVEEGFGLNYMHIVRIDGAYAKVSARSETAFRSQHIELKEILAKTQQDFYFEEITGTLVCVYFPDYMGMMNATGWHLHFLSEDRTKGGHVFDVQLKGGSAKLMKIDCIEIQLPKEPAFDTYSLLNASDEDIRKVEQGKS
ncbi:MAG: acetolactate decarboxylase [Eubacterium sp.]|nr:acetolactate decarboxylase [Eubacterium sp.]